MPDTAQKGLFSRPHEAAALLYLRRLLLRAPFALPLAGVVAAILGGAWWLLAAVAAGVALLMRLHRIGACLVLCTLIAALHEGLHEGLRARAAEDALAAWGRGDAVTCEGTVVDQLRRGCLLRDEGTGAVLALRGETPFAEGDRVRVSFALRRPEPPPIEGMFDRAAWMRSRGIAAEADYIGGEYLGHPFSWAALRGVATGMRHALAARLMPPGTEDDARRQVLCALVLGARELAEDDTLLPFRRGGCLHAFAVSGMHVVLLAGLLWPLLRLLRVRPVVGRWVQLAVLGVYVLVTGFSVPAVRAYVMLAALMMALAFRRRAGLVNTWCFAALVVLLVEPWQLYSAGFLLSFSIYAAICMGASLCLRESGWVAPDAFIPPRIYTRLEQWQRAADYSLRGTVAVALVAWLVSLPLTYCLFHTLTPWSFATNIAIAPLIPLAMGAGLAALAFAGVPLLGAASSWCALHAAQLLMAVAAWLGYLPGAYLPAVPPQPPQAAMLLGTGYGGSACVLGNPGLVIGCGSEVGAALQVEPALFHAGFAPSALLLPQPTKAASGGAGVLQRSWPQMRVIPSAELGQQPLVLEGEAGRFTLYAPAPSLPQKPAVHRTPIVLWEWPDGRRLLYVGDAARATFEQLPPEARRADTLVLGHNPVQPLADPAMLRASGATTIILLPSAAANALDEASLAPGTRLLRVGEKGCLFLP